MIHILAIFGIDDLTWAAVFWAAGTAAASMALSILLAPKPEHRAPKSATEDQFKFPIAEEGVVIPVLFGTIRITGPNVVWWGDLRVEALTEKVDGGLFHSDKKVTVGYRYHVGIHFILCQEV